MKFDDASWHHDGDWPEGLDRTHAFTHTGMFLAWLVLNGLAAREFLKEVAREVSSLKSRQITPGRFFEAMDGKFVDDMVGREVLPFVEYYFESGKWPYMDDYHEIVAEGLPTLYHVQDSWENYDKIAPRISESYDAWKRAVEEGTMPRGKEEIRQLFIAALGRRLKSMKFRFLKGDGDFKRECTQSCP